jgi:hypothetical protein
MRTFEDNPVQWDETLWRYFRPERFEALVGERSLYFASANQFTDPFEGAAAVIMNPPPPDPRYAEMEYPERAFRELKRLTKVSCWHRAEYESDAMWQLYAGERKGIAVCTTPARLRDAVGPFRLEPQYGAETIWGGPVRYADLTQIRLRAMSMERFFVKHRAFEWEREFRMAISLAHAEENAVTIPPDGVNVPVDLDRLIDHVILGPGIAAEARAEVAVAAQRAGFGDRVRISSLLGTPRYI